MSEHPVSPEVAAAFAGFVVGGNGPTHSTLSRVFGRAGYGHVAPYNSQSQAQQPNKQDRIRDTVNAAVREPHRSRELVDGLLAELRAARYFTVDDSSTDGERARRSTVQSLQAAFARIDWELANDGELRPASIAVVAAVGRPAIEDQLRRLRRATDDPALLLGTAKELMESTAKYVLEAFSVPFTASTSFEELWHHARDRLSLLPQQVDVERPGGKEVRTVLEASWAIARMANELRKSEGTGHGRTLPTGVSPEVALLVVR